MTEIQKQSFTIPVSREMVELFDGEQFPRRRHYITHPITTVQRIEYNAFVERWSTIMAQKEAIYAEGEKRGWARGDGGYEWDEAELLPLEPRVETIYDETFEEWRERVAKIRRHHDETGEWLEEPQKRLMDRIMEQYSFGFTAPEPPDIEATHD